MKQRSRQSDFIEASNVFRPSLAWVRLSFLDLMGEGSQPPLDSLEPAYIDGATLVAVWPEGELDGVQVMTWAPDRVTARRLHQLQVDWPAALCDVRVRMGQGSCVEFEPCRRNRARSASLSKTTLGRRVWAALERGARGLGRCLSCAPG